jgi:hypothetical protein
MYHVHTTGAVKLRKKKGVKEKVAYVTTTKRQNAMGEEGREKENRCAAL